MNLKLNHNDITEYLKTTQVIDYDHPSVTVLAETLKRDYGEGIELVKATFEYVRDQISHSIDVQGDVVTCTASDVLKHQEGFCYAKSHLLAALLRCNRIPAGFCYQKLVLNDETADYLILHGLNGVYVKEIERWIRLDARGNNEHVDAQFSITEEKLAYPIREDKHESDIMIVFEDPDKNVLEKLNRYQHVNDLLNDLPKQLSSEIL